MKNLIKFSAAAFAIVAVASCSKEVLSETAEQAFVPVTITADLSQTKAEIVGNNVVWNEGDSIAIWAGDTKCAFKLMSGAGTTTATFSGVIPEGSTMASAVYPYACAGTTAGAYTVPSTQVIPAGKASDPAAVVMTAEASGTNFSFVNPCGLLRITLPANVTSVVLKASTGTVTAKTPGTAGAYNIVLPAGDYAGFTMVTICNGNHCVKVTDKTLTVAAGKYVAMSYPTPDTTVPQTISAADDFIKFLSVADTYATDETVTLGGDIDLSAKTVVSGTSFAGTLDGNGKTVKVNASAPLLSTLTGTVTNLTVDGAVKSELEEDATNGHPLAALVNVSTGKVVNCTNKASVTMTCTGKLGSPVVAGLVAFQQGGTFSGNKNYGAVSLSHGGSANVAVTGFNRKPFVVTAGVVGVIVSATAQDCVNEGSVNVTCTNVPNVAARHYIGGVVGTPEDAKVISCVNRGAVTADFTDSSHSAQKQVWLGGVIGGRNGDVKTIDGAYVEGCDNYGDCTITVENSVNNYLAGIAGQATVEATGTSYTSASSTIQKLVNCHNYGKLTKNGVGGCRIGGIQGGAATLENCVNEGEIVINSISTSGAVGGLVGYPTQAYHPVTGSKNTGNITVNCDVAFRVGGLFGQAGNTTQSYNGCSVNCTIVAPSSVLAGIIVGGAPTLATGKTVTYGTAEAPFKVKGTVKGTALTSENYTSYLSSDGAPTDGKITTAASGVIDVTNVQYGE